MLKNFSTVKSIIEIEDASKGIILKNIPADATIRVDRKSNTVASANIFPEMTISRYVELFGQLSNAYPFTKLSSGLYTDVVFYFSNGGVLPLDENNSYEVTIDNNTDTNEVEVHNLDAFAQGRAIRVQRVDVKGTLTEKVENLFGIERMFFPNGLPEKLEFHVKENGLTRKVTVSKEQLQLTEGVNQVIGKNGTAYVYETSHKTYNVGAIDEVIVHTLGNGTDFTYYKVDIL